MHISAYMTGTIVEFHGEDDYTEEHGWIDERWSMHEVWESRNDVHPVAEWREWNNGDREDHPTANDFIHATLDEYLGAYEPSGNGDGTYYGQDGHIGIQDGKVYTYALHFFYKECVNGVWVEIPIGLTE